MSTLRSTVVRSLALTLLVVSCGLTERNPRDGRPRPPSGSGDVPHGIATTGGQNLGTSGGRSMAGSSTAVGGQAGDEQNRAGGAGLGGRDDGTAGAADAGGGNLAGESGGGASADDDIELVRMFGAPLVGEASYSFSAPLAVDTAGNLFAGLNTGPGAQHLLPDGQDTLWTGPYAVAKFDSQARLLWTVPTNAPVAAVATVGTDVWAALLGYPGNVSAVKIGSATFPILANHLGNLVLVKLSGATGDIVDRDQLDCDEGCGIDLFLAADADGAWIVTATTGAIEHGAATLTPPDTHYDSFLYRKGVDAARWLPGTPFQLGWDPNHALVVSLVVNSPLADLTLGGTPITTTGNSGQFAVARYGKDLSYQASFLMPADYTGRPPIVPDAASVLFVGAHGTATIEERDYTGALSASRGEAPFPFTSLAAKLDDGKLYWQGYTGFGASSFGGRSFLGHFQPLFMKFDRGTGQLEHAVTFESDALFAYYGGISSFVVTDNGASAMLAVSFDNALTFASRTYAAPGNSGIALVKVDLTQP